ncbi:MAG: peptidyl-prolyl cis-trans isomerase [Halioglobus sp.]
MEDTHSKGRSSWLVLGAAIGALLAASGLIEDQLSPIEDTVIATIDGESIYTAEFINYVEALENDRGKPLKKADKTHILNRLIDEKLLIRHGEISGLTRTESAVRKAIVDAVIENIISARKGVLPTDQELETFYQENQAYFSHTPLLRIKRMLFRGDQANKRAEQAHRALLAGQTFSSVTRQMADDEILSLPDSPIPTNRLANYLGPSLTQASEALAPGQYSKPLASGSSWVILALLEKRPGETPQLAVIRDQVLREYQRRGNDQALRDYLDELRADADVRINKSRLQAEQAPD